ncbi:MAG: hypothetical protein U9N46_05205 [Euryarchaeota archaeon]|nr:hypothetical protein [Euryarchaeota archaeon]
MDRIKVIAGVLIMIVLVGMPAGAQAEGDGVLVAIYLRRKRR